MKLSDIKISRSCRLTLFVLAWLLIALPAAAKSWEFTAFDVDIFIQSDGSFIVRETQTVDFIGDFTFFYRSIEMNKFRSIRDISVTDEDGEPVKASIYDQDGKKFIKLNFDIEDEERTWIFEYTIIGGLGYFTDHDELYWNAVSNERESLIKSSRVRVVLPAAAPMIDMRSKLFYGPRGSRQILPTHRIVDDRTFEFKARNLEPNTDLTIVAGWPKGIVDEPFIKSRAWKVISGIIGGLVFLLIAGIMAFMFLRYGRDPSGRQTIIPQYEPPNEVGPLILSVLMKEHVSSSAISAAVVDLARRGYLRIYETVKDGLLKDKRELEFERLKSSEELGEAERLVFDGIFPAEQKRVKIDDLENKFYKQLPKIKQAAFSEAKKLGYYSRNPLAIKLSYMAVGLVIISAAIVSFFMYSEIIYISAGAAGGGLSVLGFANFMSRRTPEGVLAYEHALGFRDYLHTAERFRIAASTPEAFEMYLPHAMVFHVEKQWAERFTDIYQQQQPSWYVGSGAFNSVSLADSLSHAGSSMTSAFSSSPSSSSGFGGGGSAGGGGGGGGSGAG